MAFEGGCLSIRYRVGNHCIRRFNNGYLGLRDRTRRALRLHYKRYRSSGSEMKTTTRKKEKEESCILTCNSTSSRAEQVDLVGEYSIKNPIHTQPTAHTAAQDFAFASSRFFIVLYINSGMPFHPLSSRCLSTPSL